MGIGKNVVSPYQIPAPSNGAFDPNFKGGLKYTRSKPKPADAGWFPQWLDTLHFSAGCRQGMSGGHPG
jgi:hypothetical protein